MLSGYRIFVLILLQEVSCFNIVDDYKLNVTSSGPAVHGSVMTFQAQLYLQTSHIPEDKKLFRYEWKSTVDLLTETQQADFNTSLHRCFDSGVEPMKYKMKVKVYDLKSRSIFKPVAEKDVDFLITSKLNGNLQYKQDIHRRSGAQNNTFSTEYPVDFLANLTDNFRYSPNFTYKWYINDKFEAGSYENKSIMIQKTGKHTVRLDVTSTGIINDCKNFEFLDILEGSFKTDVILKGKDTNNLDLNSVKSDLGTINQIPEITTNFPAQCGKGRVSCVSIKRGFRKGKIRAVQSDNDPVSHIKVTGNRDIYKGENITLHVNFNGSPPFLFSWKLMHNNRNVDRSEEWSVKAHSMITVPEKSLSKVGKYILTIRLENDVSVNSTQHFITVNEEPVPHHSAAVVLVPVVSALAVISILLFGGVFYINYRRKHHYHHIESADFEFHKSIQKTSNEGWFWTNMKDAFRSLFSLSNSGGSWERIHNSNRSGSANSDQNRRYGTMVSPVES